MTNRDREEIKLLLLASGIDDPTDQEIEAALDGEPVEFIKRFRQTTENKWEDDPDDHPNYVSRMSEREQDVALLFEPEDGYDES